MDIGVARVFGWTGATVVLFLCATLFDGGVLSAAWAVAGSRVSPSV